MLKETHSKVKRLINSEKHNNEMIDEKMANLKHSIHLEYRSSTL